MFKRGVSPVVATVLLLVLTVVIAAVVFSFVVPFVNEQLGNSKACLNVLDGVEFADSKFNCYATSTSGFETGFSVKIKKEGVTGVRVSLIDVNGNSDVFDITDGKAVLGGQTPSIRNIGGNFGANEFLEFSSVGGQRTYKANEKYAQAEVSPVTESGDVCAVADVVEFTLCDSSVVF